MSERDWFRKESWTPADQADFFARLNRTRAYNRAQYLRIQAVHLESVGECEAALQLLDLLLSEYPENIETAVAQHQRARCLEVLGRPGDAEVAYRASFEAMRGLSHARTGSHLDFALFAVRHERDDLYAEAHAVLGEFSDHMIFPIEIYKYSAAKALLLARTGRDMEARIFARRALEEARRETSGLRYHPKIGLVEKSDRQLQRELKRLASRTKWSWTKA